METIAKVDYWNRAPLQVDHAENDFRRLRQSRHLDGANDPLDRRQTQGDPQFIEAKDNKIRHGTALTMNLSVEDKFVKRERNYVVFKGVVRDDGGQDVAIVRAELTFPK